MSKKINIYTDGSYNADRQIYGCGAVLIDGNEKILRMHKTGHPDEGANGWNINGEIDAAVMAIEKAIELGYDNITIHHDYEGVGKWADKMWKAKKSFTKAYAKKIDELRTQVMIRFVRVPGHSGSKWNDIADEEAREAAEL